MGKKKRYRGHYCSICGCIKSNEQFSGKGHRDHICKKCQKMPKAKRQEIRDRDFVWSMLDQKNISKGNIQTLERIASAYSGKLGEQGAVIVEVAKVKPHKKKRIRWLKAHRRPLYLDLVRLGLISDWDDENKMNFEFDQDTRKALELRCLEIDTELRFRAELIEAYEADVLGESKA